MILIASIFQYHPQSNLMQEEINEFEVHPATTRHHHVSPQASILNACKALENQLVQQQLKKAVDDLLSVCRTEYASGVQGQIFPVQLRKNQEGELEQFLYLLENEMKIRKEELFRKKRLMMEENEEDDRVKLLFLNGFEIRDLVLQMYIYLEEHPHHEMVVFIARDITDLSEHNLYCFEKALKKKKFVSIMCTFSTFENQTESLSHNEYEKYHISLYQPKELFCQFVYECMAQKHIMAYLPEGILALISDMDYYSLSFRQSCRRFCFCLERALMMSPKERYWVEFDKLITLIEEVIQKKFKLYFGYKNSLQKILKVILSEKEGYAISQKAVSLQVAMGAHFSPSIDENDIMSSIRDSLRKYLGGKRQFVQYASYLVESEDVTQQPVKKKKSRFDQLGIDTKKNITPKHRLEDQITKIIKHATQSIRMQAANIDWNAIKYDLRIRPQIPVLIVKALQASEQTRDLTEDIRGEYYTPVSKYIEQWDKKDIGRLIYLLKTLEISGLVDLMKKQQRPSICNNFFQKANFKS